MYLRINELICDSMNGKLFHYQKESNTGEIKSESTFRMLNYLLFNAWLGILQMIVVFAMRKYITNCTASAVCNNCIETICSQWQCTLIVYVCESIIDTFGKSTFIEAACRGIVNQLRDLYEMFELKLAIVGINEL